MEKFCLKWNDFQTTVSQSFGLLRKEADFFDVTLVTDDEVQLSAHKLVLAASSSFFKSILRKSSHSHPLIYLSGVNSANLEFILNYIYQGEVQIFQEQLDSFLDVAQKLKVSGLISDEEPYEDEAQPRFILRCGSKIESIRVNFEKEEDDKAFVGAKDLNLTNKTVALDTQDESEIKSKISEMLRKVDGNLTCTMCGKVGRDVRNMRRHAETHIDGLSYPCNICDKTFRNKHQLQCHKSSYHRK